MNLSKLSYWARHLISDAAAESTRHGHRYLGVEHLFVALRKSSRNPLASALEDRIDLGGFCEELMTAEPAIESAPWGDEMLFTPRCREVLRIAGTVAGRHGAPHVEETHILEALLREGRSAPLRRLRSAGVAVADLFDAVAPRPMEPATHAETPTLNQYGRDLTALAARDALSPVIGRDAELGLLAEVLLRSKKNNPVLVGDAGVGKTAVVEGLARRLVSDACPAPLRGARLVELSVASLVAGTKYRGEFEQRLLNVIGEASADPRVILFLDEIHTLIGAGASADEGLDASNILKPSLARGEIRCIGATTIAEYRRHVERDAALDRRFEKVLVDEPSAEATRRILDGLLPSLEVHHELGIDPEAVEAALELTVRYVPSRRLPDKAIDALDQSCARCRLNALAAEGDGGRPTVVAADIARTVAQWTGIPVERISEQEARDLLRLEERLRRRVVGQDPAVAAVSRAVLTSRAGLADPRRPSGVFLFLGPTGVGKTELARGIAEVLFGDAKRLIRFDMSEYTEPHAAAKLIGAPPGYVGYQQEGLLIAAVRTTPHSVVLFDEIEKAHPQIFDLFLQIFDDGRLSSAHGTEADFRHAVIVMTSNLNLSPPQEKRVGFVEQAGDAPEIDPRLALTGAFRPELVNRIDEIVVFNPLGRRELRVILERYVGEIERLASARRLALVLDDGAREFLIEQSAPQHFGARELRRVVDRHLRQPLARELIERGDDDAGTIRVTVGEGGLRFAGGGPPAGSAWPNP